MRSDASATWRDTDFPRLDDEPQGLAPCLQSLRAMHTNGDVLHRRFASPEHPDLGQYTPCAARDGACFLERFWQSGGPGGARIEAAWLHERPLQSTSTGLCSLRNAFCTVAGAGS